MLSEVFKLHLEEMRAMQEEIAKKQHDIELLETVVEAMRTPDSDLALD